MSRTVKIILGVLVGLAVVVVAAVVFLFSSLDSLVEEAIETYGSQATRAQVRVDDVEIAPTSGEGELRGLVIGNPQGFKTRSAFAMDDVRIRIDMGTVTKDTVVINEIRIEKPVVTYELGEGGSNWDALKRNVAAFAGAGKKGEKATGTKGSGGEGPKLLIRKLSIAGGVVNVSATALQGRKLNAPLPTIVLTDIGKRSGGATPEAVIRQVLDAVSQGVGQSVATLNLDEVLGAAKEKARQAVEGAVSGGAAKGVEGVLKKGTKGVGGALKGLLPGSQ